MIEIDMVVVDSLKAISDYEFLFDIEIIEKTRYTKGLNEVVFILKGTRFHLLDENIEYHLIAPKRKDNIPIWFNLNLENIESIMDRAKELNLEIIQDIMEHEEMKIKNSIFLDNNNYMWMLTQVLEELSFEKRKEIMEKEMGIEEV